MDSESEGLKRQLARLEQTIQAEMEKGKVLQVCFWQAQLQVLSRPHPHARGLQWLHSAILRMLQHRIMLLGHANEAAIKKWQTGCKFALRAHRSQIILVLLSNTRNVGHMHSVLVPFEFRNAV